MIPTQRLLWYGIAGLVLLLIQLNLGFIAVESVTPDLLVILVIVIALCEGQFSGLVAGFVLGLLFDLISNDITGTNALSKTLVGFVAGYFYDEQMEPQQAIGSVRFLGIVILTTLIHNVVYYFFYVKPTDLSFSGFFLRSGVAASLYTTVVAVVVMLGAARKKRW